MVLSRPVSDSVATTFAAVLQTHRTSSTAHLQMREPLTTTSFIETTQINRQDGSVTYTGYAAPDKKKTSFTATVRVKLQPIANSSKNNLRYTCQSNKLNLEEQYLLIATQSAQARLNAGKTLDRIELMDLDRGSAQRSDYTLETKDGQAVQLSAKEHAAITAYLQVYARLNKSRTVTVIYRGMKFLSLEM